MRRERVVLKDLCLFFYMGKQMMDNTITRLKQANLFPENIYQTDHSTTMQVYIYGVEVDLDLVFVAGEYSYTLYPPRGGTVDEGIVSAEFSNLVNAFALRSSGFEGWQVELYDILNRSDVFEIVRHSCIRDIRTLKLDLASRDGKTVNFTIRNYGPTRFAYIFSSAGMPNRVDGTANEEHLGLNPDKILRILSEIFEPSIPAQHPLVDTDQPAMSMLESLSQRLDELILAP